MAGSIFDRMREAPFGSKEYTKALRDDALSEAQLARAKGFIDASRIWLGKARRHTNLLKLMARNDAWEREHGPNAVPVDGVETH